MMPVEAENFLIKCSAFDEFDEYVLTSSNPNALLGLCQSSSQPFFLGHDLGHVVPLPATEKHSHP
jgi:hypothetical protein